MRMISLNIKTFLLTALSMLCFALASMAQILQNDTIVCDGQSVTIKTRSSGVQPCLASIFPSNLQNGLVAYYPFCGNANDASGNANNGTVTSATLTTDRTNTANKAYYFNGSARIANNNNALRTLIDSNKSFSVALWFNRDVSGNMNATSQERVIWAIDGFVNILNSISYKRVHIRLGQVQDTVTYIVFERLNTNTMGNSPCNVIYKTNNFISPGTWNYLIASYDGSDVKIYLNGEQLTTVWGESRWYTGTQNRATSMGGPDNIVRGFTLGASNEYNYTTFAGKLDDVTLYNRALTAQEVSNICSYAWSNGASTNSITVTPNQTTTYTLTVTENGNSYTDSVTIAVNPIPVASIDTFGSTTLCQGGVVVLRSYGPNYIWSNGSTYNQIFVSNSGTYTVTVYDVIGCSDSASQIVTVNPVPNVSVTPLPEFSHINAASITLSGSPSGGFYAGSGVIGNQFTPSGAGLGLKPVSYTYTNSYNCSNSAITSTIVYDTTGTLVTVHLPVIDTLKINGLQTVINSHTNSNLLEIYPNPANTHLLIDFGYFASIPGYTFKIVNALGQIVLNQAITQQRFSIESNTLGTKGIYLLYIQDKNQSVISQQKIVLQ